MKDLNSLINFARMQDWSIERTTNHIRFTNNETGAFSITPSTPSDWRAFQNMVADLRRKGLNLPRKAHRKKLKPTSTGLGEQLARQLDLDLTIVRLPHIEEIIGQWRDVSWFDFDTANPLADDQHEAVQEADIVAAILVAPGLKMAEPDADGRGLFVGLNSKEVLNGRPGDRQLFISYCAYKYWHSYAMDEAPDKCACGQKFPSMAKMAQHVVFEQEREHFDHEPDPEKVFPWSDPDQLDLLFQTSNEEQLEQLRAELERESGRTREARQELQALKDRMKALVG